MKLNRSRIFCSVVALTVVSGGAMAIFGASTVQSAQDTAPAAFPAPAAAPVSASASSDDDAGDDSSCLSDPAVLTEINKRKQDLDQEQRDVAAEQAELEAREAAIGDEMKKLESLRDEISGIQGAQKKAGADKVAKVVATLEGMSPKAAAQMLTDLDDGLAVAAIAQMSTAKLSKVMNALDPKRAAKLTELLAGVVRAGDSRAESDASNGAAVATNTQTKGGESNDKQFNKQPESIISGGPEQFAGRAPSSAGQAAGGR